MTTRTTIALALLGLALAAPVPAAAAAAGLDYDLEGLDLDTGTVLALDGGPDWDGDVRIAYNADRAIKPVVFHNGAAGVQLATLAETAYADVSLADVSGLTFSVELDDRPCGPADTLVVLTDQGDYYKIGNVTEAADGATFDYEKLE